MYRKSGTQNLREYELGRPQNNAKDCAYVWMNPYRLHIQ